MSSKQATDCQIQRSSTSDSPLSSLTRENVASHGDFDDIWCRIRARPMLAPTSEVEPDSSCSTAAVATGTSSKYCSDAVVNSRPPTQPPLQHDLGRSVMFQSFGWDSWQHHHHSFYQYLQSRIPELQAAGVTHVWLPPPSHSVAPQGYMPDQLYDLSSAYGSQQQLKECVAALRAAGISAIADVVINHRCADEQDEVGRWNRYRDKVPHAGPSLAWGRWAIAKYGSGDMFGGIGRADSGGVCWAGAPNLDHSNPTVREGLVAWLRHLQDDIGFGAWRFDFARGYSSKYVKTYVDSTTSQFSLNVGEVWVDLDWSGPGHTLAASQDVARQKLAEWIEGCGQRATVFDFVTKGVLTEAVRRTQYWRLRDSQGRAAGLLGWWPQQSVTFVDNHDTGSSQQHWPFPADRLALGYAYILTHPGVPCVFAEHYFGGQRGTADTELRGTIDALLQARRRVGITATSSLVITAAEADMYVAVISGEHGQLTVKLGPRFEMGDLLPQEPYWKQLCCGQDFCVWESTSISSAAGSSNSLAGGFGGSSVCSGSSSSLCGQ